MFCFSIQDIKKTIIKIFILEIKTKVVNLNFPKTIDCRLQLFDMTYCKTTCLIHKQTPYSMAFHNTVLL